MNDNKDKNKNKDNKKSKDEDKNKEDVKKIIGLRIKSERTKRKMSIEDLADLVEKTASYVGLIERGQRGTNLRLLLRFCHVFNISIEEMIADTPVKTEVMCENKNDEYKSKLLAAESFLRALNKKELDFILSTMKNLYQLRHSDNKSNDDQDSGEDIREYFY